MMWGKRWGNRLASSGKKRTMQVKQWGRGFGAKQERNKYSSVLVYNQVTRKKVPEGGSGMTSVWRRLAGAQNSRRWNKVSLGSSADGH